MTRAEAKVLWDGYVAEFRWVPWLLVPVAALMGLSAVLALTRGLRLQAALFGCMAFADVLLIDSQVRLSAARHTIRHLLAQYEPVGEDD